MRESRLNCQILNYIISIGEVVKLNIANVHIMFIIVYSFKIHNFGRKVVTLSVANVHFDI